MNERKEEGCMMERDEFLLEPPGTIEDLVGPVSVTGQAFENTVRRCTPFENFSRGVANVWISNTFFFFPNTYVLYNGLARFSWEIVLI